MLHNLMVNLDTKDLIESYTKSLRYREIYNYVADGRLPGNAITQKKIAGKAANYVVVNGLLFKIAQHKESGKWTHYLLLVIPEKFESNILNMYHYSLLAMHCCDMGQNDTIGKIELNTSIILSSDNTNCKNDIQLFHQLFDELSVYRDYH